MKSFFELGIINYTAQWTSDREQKDNANRNGSIRPSLSVA